MISDKDLVFIIGAPRSGTTWLQTMLAAHPSVCSTIDELKLFDFFTVPLEQGWNYLLGLQTATGGDRNGLAAIWTDAQFYGFLSEFVDRIYTQVLAANPDATVLLDKAPAYSNCIDHIEKLLPRAKFIHMIRDGRDVASSMIAAAQGWGKPWAPRDIESAAAQWKEYVLGAQKACRYAGRYLEVRYEELLANGTQVLGGVFGFMGVSTDSSLVAGIYDRHRFEKMKEKGKGARDFSLPKEFFRKGQAGDWRNSLNPSERLLFHETAGDLLADLGYCDQSWWFENSYQRATVPLFLTLSRPSRLRTKARKVIKRALGPKWTARLRSFRTLTPQP